MTKYRCIMADPPWLYEDAGAGKRGATGRHYDSGMTAADVCEMGEWVWTKLAADDAWLFLWVTNWYMTQPDTHRICEAWGFVPKTVITWVKGTEPHRSLFGAVPEPVTVDIGCGHYARNSTEQCIVATRGRVKPLVRNVRTDFYARSRTEPHSRKPDRFYRMVERICAGPRIDLFARRVNSGWDGWGMEYPDGPTQVLCPTGKVWLAEDDEPYEE
jgi:N6-adenosine-specific RNA methylase IME4